MTAKNPKAVYACVNLGQAYCPAEIGKRGIALDADFAGFFPSSSCKRRSA